MSMEDWRRLQKLFPPPKLQDLVRELPLNSLRLDDFKQLQILGSGTFSLVRMVTLRSEAGSGYPMALKMMRKSFLVEARQVQHVKSEKNLLSSISCPFIVALLSWFQDERRLCFLLELVHGGELFGRLRREGRLPVDHSKFYAAEILLAFHHLHHLGVMYRDLKPENVLIDRNGHLKLVDFAFARSLAEEELAHTIVGTPEYLAPEIIQSKGHSFPVDLWALGVLTYEMLAGYPPFFDRSPYDIYRKILALEVKYPRHFDVKAVDLLQKVLLVDPATRLPCRGCMLHLWFDRVHWLKLSEQKIESPWLPQVEKPMDVRLFDNAGDGKLEWLEEAPKISKAEARLFEGF